MANLQQWLNDYAVQLFRQNNGGRCEYCGSALGHFHTCKLLHNNSEVLHLEPTEPKHATESEIDRLMADKIIAHAFGVQL